MNPTVIAAATQPAAQKFDRQDALLIGGVVSLLAGIGMRSIPAALITLGILCLGIVFLIQSDRNRKGADGSARK